MSGVFPFFFVVILLILVVLIILGSIEERKRREKMVAWTKRSGLHFSPDKDRGMKDRFPEFFCLKRGSNRYAYNVSQGKWRGQQMLGFDYHYETSSTDSDGSSSTTTHRFSAVIVACEIPMKSLVIEEEGFFDKVASFFGFDDIDFESAAFSDQFKVKSPDRRWAYDVLHARTMEFLLDSPRFSIEFARDHAIAWRSTRFEVAEYETALRVIHGIMERLPDYVRNAQMES